MSLLPLLQAAPPPATLRAYAHVFLALAVVWLLLLGYVLHLAARVLRLERQRTAPEETAPPA